MHLELVRQRLLGQDQKKVNINRCGIDKVMIVSVRGLV